MAETHEIAQGEHLSAIAAQYGFPDYTLIWNHPQNADLKSLRKNPNVLYPGDSLYIPDKQQGQQSCSTSQRHTFQISVKRLMLKLKLADQYEKPIANGSTTLTFDQTPVQLTSDGDGKIQQAITTDAAQCTLSVTCDQTQYQNQRIDVFIGHLDPVDTHTGQLARLNNLGYEPGESEDEQDPEFLSAVEEFQCDNHLTVDGQIGPVTRAKLLSVHGC